MTLFTVGQEVLWHHKDRSGLWPIDLIDAKVVRVANKLIQIETRNLHGDPALHWIKPVAISAKTTKFDHTVTGNASWCDECHNPAQLAPLCGRWLCDDCYDAVIAARTEHIGQIVDQERADAAENAAHAREQAKFYRYEV
jgi:hypothetical protein